MAQRELRVQRTSGIRMTGAVLICALTTAAICIIDSARGSDRDDDLTVVAVIAARQKLDTTDVEFLRTYTLPTLDDARRLGSEMDGFVVDGLIWGRAHDQAHAAVLAYADLVSEEEWYRLEQSAETRTYPTRLTILTGRTNDLAWRGTARKLKVLGGAQRHSTEAEVTTGLGDRLYRYSTAPIEAFVQDFGHRGEHTITRTTDDAPGDGQIAPVSVHVVLTADGIRGGTAAFHLWANLEPHDGELACVWWRIAICSGSRDTSVLTEATVRHVPADQHPLQLPATGDEVVEVYDRFFDPDVNIVLTYPERDPDVQRPGVRHRVPIPRPSQSDD